MILLVSSLPRETDAFATLFGARHWPSHTCRSVSDFLRIATTTPPEIVIARHRFADGHADDVLRFTAGSTSGTACPVIVLAPANLSATDEARLISLGADHVFRDPIRIEVLIQIIARNRGRRLAPHSAVPAALHSYRFAGVTVHPAERRLARDGKEFQAPPKVIELVQLLHHNAGKLVPYVELYDVLFGRRFGGDTSNCRVLLAKADEVFRHLGGDLRARVRVVPKTGYLYSPGDDAGPQDVRRPPRPR